MSVKYLRSDFGSHLVLGFLVVEDLIDLQRHSLAYKNDVIRSFFKNIILIKSGFWTGFTVLRLSISLIVLILILKYY
jgi:hypothetical protein